MTQRMGAIIPNAEENSAAESTIYMPSTSLRDNPQSKVQDQNLARLRSQERATEKSKVKSRNKPIPGSRTRRTRVHKPGGLLQQN